MDVPQGSILGLLLYAICVNNLPESVEQRQVKQYADDTAMFQSADNVSESSLASQPTSAQREGSGQLSIQVLSPAHWILRSNQSTVFSHVRRCCPQHPFND